MNYKWPKFCQIIIDTNSLTKVWDGYSLPSVSDELGAERYFRKWNNESNAVKYVFVHTQPSNTINSCTFKGNDSL